MGCSSNRVYSALYFEINAFSRAFAKNSTAVPLYGDARFLQKIPSFPDLCQTVDFVYSLKRPIGRFFVFIHFIRIKAFVGVLRGSFLEKCPPDPFYLLLLSK